MSLYRSLALSNHWLARALRRGRTLISHASIPAPRAIFIPILGVCFVCKQTWYFLYRVFVCEPLFKVHCQRYGTNLHTGAFIHDVYGKGTLIIGDDVLIDGKCTFSFAARYSDTPTLLIGDNTGIGYGCYFIIGRRITIGRNCRIAMGVYFFESPGHPSDPEMRKAGAPPNPTDVRPITIGDNVWIGLGAVVFPGVSIGDNSVVGVGAVVMNDVPANVVVLGNPARKVLSLQSTAISLESRTTTWRG